MTALHPGGAPPLLTVDREARANMHFGDAVYRSTCGCGLPSLVARPCGGKRVGEWTAGCSYCELRLFSPRRSAFFARFGFGAELASVDIERRSHAIARMRESGRAVLADVEFATIRLGGREKVVSRRPLACLACGEPDSATLRRDRYGRLYSSCAACSVLGFLYSPDSAEFNVGVAEAVSRGQLSWMALHRAGEAIWSQLGGTPELMPQTAVATKSEHQEMRHEVSAPVHR